MFLAADMFTAGAQSDVLGWNEFSLGGNELIGVKLRRIQVGRDATILPERIDGRAPVFGSHPAQRLVFGGRSNPCTPGKFGLALGDRGVAGLLVLLDDLRHLVHGLSTVEKALQ